MESTPMGHQKDIGSPLLTSYLLRRMMAIGNWSQDMVVDRLVEHQW
jgi:hypothetical protein